MTVTLPLPFRRSRTLAPGNVLLHDAAVALDVVGLELRQDIYETWRGRVGQVAQALGWAEPRCTAWPCDASQTLGFTAPRGQLRTACEANEWALCAAVLERDPCHWSALRQLMCQQASAEALARLAQLGLQESRAALPA